MGSYHTLHQWGNVLGCVAYIVGERSKFMSIELSALS